MIAYYGEENQEKIFNTFIDTSKTGDALYATSPIIKIIEKFHWIYIFNLKPDHLKYINEYFEGNLILENETTHKHYYLSTNIEYQNNLLNVFKYIENENMDFEKTF